MVYGAMPSDKCSPPPIGEVRWRVFDPDGFPLPTSRVLMAHSWFEARAKAAIWLGRDPGQLDVRQC